MKSDTADVVIIGGGLSGITQALQLLDSIPLASIIVLEKQEGVSHQTAYKVGESTSELGSSYLKDTLGLEEYFTKEHVIKLGVRFFLNSRKSKDISERLELGPILDIPQKTFHIERGKVEQDLMKMAQKRGVQVFYGSKVNSYETCKNDYAIQYVKDGKSNVVKTKWIVDASGRNGFLRKKLSLDLPIKNTASAVWFRINKRINVDDWSQKKDWVNRANHGYRNLSTNHLVGDGYWIWLIPLPSDAMSIGIVFDKSVGENSSLSNYTKTLEWIGAHEPQLALALNTCEGQVLDFKVMKNFSFNSKQYYSHERWALVGDAAAFLDPLYSPGLDFIALGNTWTVDLIKRELMGEDIFVRSKVYDELHRQLFNGWSEVYKNIYPLLHNTQLMPFKIVWDWATYWAIPNVLFANSAYTDLQFIKKFAAHSIGIGPRFNLLNENLQTFFTDWSEWGKEIDQPFSGFKDFFSLRLMYKLQKELHLQYHHQELIEKVRKNFELLEQLAAGIMQKLLQEIHHTEFLAIDPYNTSFNDSLENIHDIEKQHGSSIEIPIHIQEDLNQIWLEVKKEASDV